MSSYLRDTTLGRAASRTNALDRHGLSRKWAMVAEILTWLTPVVSAVLTVAAIIWPLGDSNVFWLQVVVALVPPSRSKATAFRRSALSLPIQ